MGKDKLVICRLKRINLSANGNDQVSAVVGRRTLILVVVNDIDNPMELAFQPKYGHVTAYQWFGDGFILVGFTAGFFIAISTNSKDIGQELFQVRNYRDKISAVAVSLTLDKAACCGENRSVHCSFERVKSVFCRQKFF